MSNTEQFRIDRDEALLSLNEETIKNFMTKYNLSIPEDERTFWGAVHKAILYINSASEEQKRHSFEWLVENNFNPIIE